MLDGLTYKNTMDKLLVIFIGIIVFMYPVTTFVSDLRTVYIVLLILLALAVLGLRWSQIKAIQLSQLEKWFLSSYFLMFATTLLSIIVMGVGVDGNNSIEIYSGFLLLMPVYFMFRLYMPSSRIIWGAIVVACYIVAARAWLEVNGYVEDIEWKSLRANGAMNPIRFGTLTLLLGFISLAGSLYIKNLKSWMKVIGIIAFFSGLYASILSQSRGGWIAIPLLLIVVLWPVFREISIRNKLALLFSIIVGGILIFNVSDLKVAERFNRAGYDIDQYQNHDNSNTSLGVRFDMYETAYNIFLQSPLFGVGVGNYEKYSVDYYEMNKDRLSVQVAMWRNPHNEVLLHMATRGVVGLLVLIMFFLVGIVLFVSSLRRYDQNTLFFSVSGLLIYIAYIHFSLSIALFWHRDMAVFFMIYVTLFASGICKEKNMTAVKPRV